VIHQSAADNYVKDAEPGIDIVNIVMQELHVQPQQSRHVLRLPHEMMV
jgi:hypothetical protein